MAGDPPVGGAAERQGAAAAPRGPVKRYRREELDKEEEQAAFAVSDEEG